MILGYPGQFDVFLAKIICSLKKKPLVLDVFMSVYLVAIERKLEGSRYSAVKMLKRIEKRALDIPDMLIQDTRQYVDWFLDIYGIKSDRFKLVPTGADDSTFKPLAHVKLSKDKFKVLYYGTFIANHGLDHILEAVKILLNHDEIEFLFIGEGPEKSRIVKLAEAEGLGNATFVGWYPQAELVEQIGTADVCLGAFGNTPQSLMTVQNKIYECMACGKAIITGTSPAVLSQFTNEVELKICERDGISIAEAILYLKEHPSVIDRIGSSARESFVENYSVKALGGTFRSHLETLIQCK